MYENVSKSWNFGCLVLRWKFTRLALLAFTLLVCAYIVYPGDYARYYWSKNEHVVTTRRWSPTPEEKVEFEKSANFNVEISTTDSTDNYNEVEDDLYVNNDVDDSYVTNDVEPNVEKVVDASIFSTNDTLISTKSMLENIDQTFETISTGATAKMSNLTTRSVLQTTTTQSRSEVSSTKAISTIDKNHASTIPSQTSTSSTHSILSLLLQSTTTRSTNEIFSTKATFTNEKGGSTLSSQTITLKNGVITSKNDANKDDVIKSAEQYMAETMETESCKPAKHVIFVKTHKTGSSTITNLLQRYAENQNLSIALPGTNHFLGWPRIFQKEFVFEYAPTERYDVICNHARFHKQRMLDLINHPDTKIVTVLRDPLHQFESQATYMNFAAAYKLNKSPNVLDAFFAKSEEEIRDRTRKGGQSTFLVKNANAFDLGLPSWNESQAAIDNAITKVERDFDLVMLSNYMPESLVLLKDLLCWELKDVAYFTMNKRPDKYRATINNVEETTRKVRAWNKIDARLFDHFNKTFWRKVEKSGDEFHKDVAKLNSLNKNLEKACLADKKAFDKTQPWFPILGFKLNNRSKNSTICQNLVRSEISFNNLLREKYSRSNWKAPKK